MAIYWEYKHGNNKNQKHEQKTLIWKVYISESKHNPKNLVYFTRVLKLS